MCLLVRERLIGGKRRRAHGFMPCRFEFQLSRSLSATFLAALFCLVRLSRANLRIHTNARPQLIPLTTVSIGKQEQTLTTRKLVTGLL